MGQLFGLNQLPAVLFDLDAQAGQLHGGRRAYASRPFTLLPFFNEYLLQVKGVGHDVRAGLDAKGGDQPVVQHVEALEKSRSVMHPSPMYEASALTLSDGR